MWLWLTGMLDGGRLAEGLPGTALAVVFSIPLGFLVARLVLNTLRSIPELIMGIIFVGAGGIGTELVGSLRLLDYPQVSALLIVILATVTLVDGLSNVLRKRLQ